MTTVRELERQALEQLKAVSEKPHTVHIHVAARKKPTWYDVGRLLRLGLMRSTCLRCGTVVVSYPARGPHRYAGQQYVVIGKAARETRCACLALPARATRFHA